MMAPKAYLLSLPHAGPLQGAYRRSAIWALSAIPALLFDDGIARRVELTASVDVTTRTIAAGLLRPMGTKAVDAWLLLARMLVPEPMRPGRPEEPVAASARATGIAESSAVLAAGVRAGVRGRGVGAPLSNDVLGRRLSWPAQIPTPAGGSPDPQRSGPRPCPTDAAHPNPRQLNTRSHQSGTPTATSPRHPLLTHLRSRIPLPRKS